MQERWPDLRRDAEEIVSRALQDAQRGQLPQPPCSSTRASWTSTSSPLVIRQIVSKLLGKLRRV
jgi:hypothetical protein